MHYNETQNNKLISYQIEITTNLADISSYQKIEWFD